MKANEVWKSKEAKSYALLIMGENPDGTIKVTFDFRFNPRTTHNYQRWYLEQFYEPAGYEVNWTLDKRLMQIPAKPVEEEKSTDVWGGDPTPEPVEISLDTLDPEKVLFGNYTGKDKVNEWKEIE